MSLLVVGSIAIDSIETPHGAVPEILGGSASHFSLAASLFAPVRLVGVVGEDFPRAYLDVLRSRPIDTAGLQVLAGRSFRWSGRYQGAMDSAETLSVELNLFGTFDPKIPEPFRDSRFVFLANGSPHVQRRVLEQVDGAAGGGRFTLLDTMNLWIEVEREALLDLLPRVDALVINEKEVRQLTEHVNLITAGKAALAMGPRIVVVKKGEHGALLFERGGAAADGGGGVRIFAAPAWPVERVTDPTGAGDTFAGGLMGALARTGRARPTFADLKRAVCTGIVAASFNVEDFGLRRLERASAAQVEARCREYVDMLSMDEPAPGRAFPAVSCASS